MNAYTLGGSQLGGYLAGASINLPTSGTANFSGTYSGEMFAPFGGIYVNGDVTLATNFSSSSFSGDISNRSFFAQSGIDNALLAKDISLTGSINSSGYLSGFALNSTAFGTVDAIIFGSAAGAVGIIAIDQNNFLFGVPTNIPETGTFSVN